MESSTQPVIGIIVPCYNECEIVEETNVILTNVLSKLMLQNTISKNSFIAYVDDGSTDDTWNIIESFVFRNNQNIKGLKLSGNVGHQNALLAGLLNFNDEAEALISIDADLQDDVNCIEEMILKFKNGVDSVYGVRKSRDSDSFFKKFSAQFFYKLLLLMKVDVIYNHADFRLSSKRVIKSLSGFKETNLFLRGIIKSIGYKCETVYYDRSSRTAGVSKYPLRKMLSFAWDGITSFSLFPLKLVSVIGFVIFILCGLMSIYALSSFLQNSIVPGWFSTVLPMYFLGGIQLFCFGIIGEYIGKIYSEVKQRPRFIIDKKI